MLSFDTGSSYVVKLYKWTKWEVAALQYKRTGSGWTLLQTQMVKEAKGGKKKIDFLFLVFTGRGEKNHPSRQKKGARWLVWKVGLCTDESASFLE